MTTTTAHEADEARRDPDFTVDWHQWLGFAVLKRVTYRGVVAKGERWWGRKKPRKRGRIVRQARKRGESWAFTRRYV